VYGHKPSLGLAPLAGFQPGPWDGAPGYPMDLAVAGPMARSARDLALAMSVLGGPDEDEAAAWTWRMPRPRRTRLEEFRIGCVLDDPIAPLASDVRAVYEDVLARLETAGATIERGWPSAVDPLTHVRTFEYLLFSLVTADAGDEEREQARTRVRSAPDDIAAAAMVEPHARWLRESQRRLELRAAWQAYFRQHDVFLLPASFTAAFPHDTTSALERRLVDTPEGQRPYLSLPTWTIFATVAGLPATTAPIGRTTAGLPVGLQILAPMWEDATSIEFAALLSDLAGFMPPPAFGE
jgi:amidase